MSNSNEKTEANPKRSTRRIEEILCPQSEIEKKEDEIKTKWEEKGQKSVDTLRAAIEDSDGCILMSNNHYYWKGLDALFPGLEYPVSIYSVNYQYDPSNFCSFLPDSRPLLDSEAEFLVKSNGQYQLKKNDDLPFLKRNKGKGIACFSSKQQQKVCNDIKKGINVSGYE